LLARKKNWETPRRGLWKKKTREREQSSSRLIFFFFFFLSKRSAAGIPILGGGRVSPLASERKVVLDGKK
jgi:hypothetical protein